MSSCLHLLKEMKTVQFVPRRGLYLMEVVSYTGFRHHHLIVHSSVFIFSVVSWTYKVCMFYLDLIDADISLLLRPLYSRNFIKTGHTVPLKYKYLKAEEELGFAADINVKYLNIYDHLTPRLQALYHEAKKVKEAKKYKFCWAKNGLLYLRKSEESTIYKFADLSELNKKFSTASVAGVNDHLQS